MKQDLAQHDRFGVFGGRYVPETLVPALDELDTAFDAAIHDAGFVAELNDLLEHYVGRPSPLSTAPRLSEQVGSRIYLKREDMLHTGAHKINNTVGTGACRRMGKRRIIAETGAGQHGVATATGPVRAPVRRLHGGGRRGTAGLQRVSDATDRCIGRSGRSGSRTLKDAINEALRDWVTNVTRHVLRVRHGGGAASVPTIVRDFHAVIGGEAREQMLARRGGFRDCRGVRRRRQQRDGAVPGFLGDPGVEMVGVEAGGSGLASGEHAASLSAAAPASSTGAYSYLLQDAAARSSRPIRSRRGWTTPAWGRNTHTSRTPDAPATSPVTDQEAGSRLRLLCRPRGSSRPSSVARGRLGRIASWPVDHRRRGSPLHQRPRRQGCRAGQRLTAEQA